MPLKQKKYENGDRFKGQLDKNKMIKDDTQGEMKYANGDRYAGYWKNGKRDGYGEMWYANGDYYEGQWEDGVKYELGMMSYNNGDTYDGLWVNDSPVDPSRIKHANAKAASPVRKEAHTQAEPVWGYLTFENGDNYSGFYQNSKPNGYGRITYANGDIHEGLWKDGNPVDASKMIKRNNVMINFVDPSKMINTSMKSPIKMPSPAKKRIFSPHTPNYPPPGWISPPNNKDFIQTTNIQTPANVITESVVAVSNNVAVAKKRCPNGTQRNKKTGQCESRNKNSPLKMVTPPKSVTKRSVTKRCPKGTRKNKKTGQCEPK